MSSKNLIESCRQYERYHRNTDKPLMKFAAFNRAHGTSLPENRAEVESKYLKTIQRARQAEGVPVRRRMRSLHSMLNGMEPAKVAPQEPMLVQSKDGVVGIYTGGSSVRRAWTNELCDYNPETFSKATEKDLQEAFMDAVLQQENPKLTSKANMVMHVMPKEESSQPEFEKLTVKLSSSVKPLLMVESRSGQLMTVAMTIMAVMSINADDIKQMLKDIKKKKSGPFCVRMDV